jgi:hypothetical protein
MTERIIASSYINSSLLRDPPEAPSCPLHLIPMRDFPQA